MRKLYLTCETEYLTMHALDNQIRRA